MPYSSFTTPHGKTSCKYIIFQKSTYLYETLTYVGKWIVTLDSLQVCLLFCPLKYSDGFLIILALTLRNPGLQQYPKDRLFRKETLLCKDFNWNKI